MGTVNVPSVLSRDARGPARPTRAPLLENGDRLTRAEFERRCEAQPDLKKAELIEGVVHMPSPPRFRNHGRPQGTLVGWLFAYAAATPGVQLGDNSTVRLDLDNEPQPDAALFIDPEAGGQARVDEDDYIEGVPELVAEIAASSASCDLHDKLHASAARRPAPARASSGLPSVGAAPSRGPRSHRVPPGARRRRRRRATYSAGTPPGRAEPPRSR